MGRRRPKTRPTTVRSRSFGFAASGIWYDVASAKRARSQILQLDVDKLSEPIVASLPYPGTGCAPARPGGDVKIVGRFAVRDLEETFEDVRTHGAVGSIIYLSGPIGCGKSCVLRAFACNLIAVADSSSSSSTKKRRIVCLWNLEAAVDGLVAELKAALRFTYANDDAVLAAIDGLGSKDDVNSFIDGRKEMEEEFYFIIDGAEAMDRMSSSGEVLSDSERRTELEGYMLGLVRKGRLSIIGLSPMAEKRSRKRKAGAEWVVINDGLVEDEYSVYRKELSVLDRVCNTPEREQDLEYYAGGHPFSLAVFDRCCWLHAERRYDALVKGKKAFRTPDHGLTDDQVVEEMAEEEDWEEVLELFVGSAELQSIRILVREQLEKQVLGEGQYDLRRMVKLDRRFVYGDPDDDNQPEYVTQYIERIYTEEIRDAERKSIFKGGAWEPYCRYLLNRGTPVNWAQMGWLCEDLASEVISLKGCILDGLKIHRARTQRFGAVPEYKSWSREVLEAGVAIFFLPMKYNYGSIDGVLVFKVGAVLHFVAIQITVNEQRHLHSAAEFMTLHMVSKWIPTEHLSDWKMHFVFLCCKESLPSPVKPNLHPVQSGGFYGTVGYDLHTVSFTSAFNGLVDAQVYKTLEEIARKRDEAFVPAAAAASATPAAAAASATPAAAAAAIIKILSASEFTKAKLLNIAAHHHADVHRTATKEVLRSKIAERIMAL